MFVDLRLKCLKAGTIVVQQETHDALAAVQYRRAVDGSEERCDELAA